MGGHEHADGTISDHTLNCKHRHVIYKHLNENEQAFYHFAKITDKRLCVLDLDYTFYANCNNNMLLTVKIIQCLGE